MTVTFFGAAALDRATLSASSRRNSPSELSASGLLRPRSEAAAPRLRFACRLRRAVHRGDQFFLEVPVLAATFHISSLRRLKL
jgi:hypothetical protein